MEENRRPKRALDYRPGNERKRGRPGTSRISGIRKTMTDREMKIHGEICKMRQQL